MHLSIDHHTFVEALCLKIMLPLLSGVREIYYNPEKSRALREPAGAALARGRMSSVGGGITVATDDSHFSA